MQQGARARFGARPSGGGGVAHATGGCRATPLPASPKPPPHPPHPPTRPQAMGDKTAARRLAQSCGVPVVPGTDDALESPAAAEVFAAEAGYPVILKARSGGGGRGMRVVRSGEQWRPGRRQQGRAGVAAWMPARGRRAVLTATAHVRPTFFLLQLRRCRTSSSALRPRRSPRLATAVSVPRCSTLCAAQPWPHSRACRPVHPLPHAHVCPGRERENTHTSCCVPACGPLSPCLQACSVRSTWPTRGTSRSRSWQTSTAAWCTCTTATAPCSAATKRCGARRGRGTGRGREGIPVGLPAACLPGPEECPWSF
jgi:hypothetical protein